MCHYLLETVHWLHCPIGFTKRKQINLIIIIIITESSYWCSCFILFRMSVIPCMNPHQYLLSDPWILLWLRPDTGRAAVVIVQVDIPERPVEVQENVRAKGGSPFSHSCSHVHTCTHARTRTHRVRIRTHKIFHIPGLFVNLFWLLERGSEGW